MTLGEVIDALKRSEPDATVHFDFCYTAPTTVASYRGYYDDLALGWQPATYDDESKTYWPLVATILERLQSAVGKRFEGWKGGFYLMDTDTMLWVANPGETSGTSISRVSYEYGTVILHTEKLNY